MATTISGSTGVTYPSGGVDNTAGAGVGTTDTQTLTNKTIQGGAITSGTAVTLTTQTSVDYTSIPSWVKRITVMFNGLSLSGTSQPLIQIGTGGTPTTTGYLADSCNITSASTGLTAYTAGFGLVSGTATNIVSGAMTIFNLSGNIWVASGVMKSNTTTMVMNAGDVTLSGVLNIVRITTVNGTDTFDAGSVNILYEG
jgi:hypothetical protein